MFRRTDFNKPGYKLKLPYFRGGIFYLTGIESYSQLGLNVVLG